MSRNLFFFCAARFQMWNLSQHSPGRTMFLTPNSYGLKPSWDALCHRWDMTCWANTALDAHCSAWSEERSCVTCSLTGACRPNLSSTDEWVITQMPTVTLRVCEPLTVLYPAPNSQSYLSFFFRVSFPINSLCMVSIQKKFTSYIVFVQLDSKQLLVG